MSDPAAPATTEPRSAARWVYEGVWAALADLFHVPRQPPSLPSAGDVPVIALRPCDGWLLYRKTVFWIVLALIDGACALVWLAIAANNFTLALWLAPLFILLIVLPDIPAYVAVYLRYDTTWYVLSDRSMRIRRGVMTVRETTITFDNIQNVKVMQGPLQRYFGFSDLVVETAGGGGGGKGDAGAAMGAHVGLLEGVEDPAKIRELIMDKVRASKSAGLGDDRDAPPAVSSARPTAAMSSPAQLEALRRIAGITASMAR